MRIKERREVGVIDYAFAQWLMRISTSLYIHVTASRKWGMSLWKSFAVSCPRKKSLNYAVFLF